MNHFFWADYTDAIHVPEVVTSGIKHTAIMKLNDKSLAPISVAFQSSPLSGQSCEPSARRRGALHREEPVPQEVGQEFIHRFSLRWLLQLWERGMKNESWKKRNVKKMLMLMLQQLVGLSTDRSDIFCRLLKMAKRQTEFELTFSVKKIKMAEFLGQWIFATPHRFNLNLN